MSKLNSPVFILHAAKEFFEKGTLAASANFKTVENEVLQFDSMIHPKLCMPIVNIMFSLELTLKGLLKQSNVEMRTHDILRLFNAVDTGIKARIIKHYHSHDIYKNYIAIRLLKGDGTQHSKPFPVPAPPKTEEGVIELLRIHKSYFESFRYLFEFDDNEEYLFMFREISNFAFSALVIFGETQNLKVISTVKKQAALESRK